jgi:hypothetical protein
MKNIQFIAFLYITVTVLACKKEEPIPIEPIIPTPPPIYVPIFEPGDTTKGAAYSNKLTASWKGSVYCKTSFLDATKLSLTLYTFTNDGSTREELHLGSISKNDGVGQYGFATDIYSPAPTGKVFTFYNTWASDGDVTEDAFSIDSTDQKNSLVITKIDLANKRVEGTFHASYNLQEPRINPLNPKKVTFSVGRFWATIRD